MGRQRTWRGGKDGSDAPSQLLDLERRRSGNSEGLDACKDGLVFTRNGAAKRRSRFGEKVMNSAIK